MASIQGIGNGHGAIASRLGDLVHAVSKWRRQRRVYRDTVKELGSLDARELGDLGLNRSLITRTAHEAARRA